MDKKCETCVFCTQKPIFLKHLPNDWLCSCNHSKWKGYWPTTGVCEMHSEPTRKTIKEVLSEKQLETMKKLYLGLACMFKQPEEGWETWINQDSAVLTDYGFSKDGEFEENNPMDSV